MLRRLFHNLGPLTLDLFNPNDLSLCLLGTMSFDLADLSLCFSDGLAPGTWSLVKYAKISSVKHDGMMLLLDTRTEQLKIFFSF